MLKFAWLDHDGGVLEGQPLLCRFGITEGIALAISSFAVSAGVGAETAGILGTVGAGALEGGAIGAITDPKAPLKGAEFGAISGGVAAGAAPAISDVLGTGAIGTDILAGGIGGAIGAAATGRNIGTSALEGGAVGGIQGALAGSPTAGTPTSSPGPAGGAVGQAAPVSVPAAATPAEGLNATAFENTSFEGYGSTGNVAGPYSQSAGLTGAIAPTTPVQTGTLPDLTPGLTPPVGSQGISYQGSTPSAPIGSGPSLPGSGGVASALPGAAPGAGGGLSDVSVTPSPLTGEFAGGAAAPSGGIASALPATPAAPSAAAASGTAGAAAPAAPQSGFGQVTSFLKSNPWVIPAAGIGYELLKGQQALPGEAALNSNAASLDASAKQLQNYFNTGTLPPGVQQSINQASQAATASIRSQYAAIGDTGSSAEQQDIANVQARAVSQGSQIALQLLQQGVSEEGMADQLYTQLMNSALEQDQQLGQSIAMFATALVPSLTPTKQAA